MSPSLRGTTHKGGALGWGVKGWDALGKRAGSVLGGQKCHGSLLGSLGKTWPFFGELEVDVVLPREPSQYPRSLTSKVGTPG